MSFFKKSRNKSQQIQLIQPQEGKGYNFLNSRINFHTIKDDVKETNVKTLPKLHTIDDDVKETNVQNLPKLHSQSLHQQTAQNLKENYVESEFKSKKRTFKTNRNTNSIQIDGLYPSTQKLRNKSSIQTLQTLQDDTLCASIQEDEQSKIYQAILDANDSKKIFSQMMQTKYPVPIDKIPPNLNGPGQSIYNKHIKQLDKVIQQNSVFGVHDSYLTSCLRGFKDQNQFPTKIGIKQYSGKSPNNDGKLQINHMNFGDKYINILVNSDVDVSQIDHFCLKDNRITKESSQNLLKIITPHAKFIDLSNNEIGLEGLTQIAINLTIFPCTITDLNLSENNLGDAAVKMLLKALISNTSLQCLNLSKNQLTDDINQEIFEYLKRGQITDLYLHWNYFKGSFGKLFFRGLRKNQYLRVLDLSNNNLGISNNQDQSSIQEICKFFQINNKIMHLDISFNNFNYQDTITLSTFLKQNNSIYGFHYYGNPGYIDTNRELIPQEFNKDIKLVTNQPQIEGLKAIRKIIREERDICLKDCCWICEGWQEKIFVWDKEESGKFVDTLYIHFNFENFKYNLFGKMDNLVRKIQFKKMVPPGNLNYFFSDQSQNIFLQANNNYIGHDKMVENIRVFDGTNIDRHLDKIHNQFIYNKGSNYCLQGGQQYYDQNDQKIQSKDISYDPQSQTILYNNKQKLQHKKQKNNNIYDSNQRANSLQTIKQQNIQSNNNINDHVNPKPNPNTYIRNSSLANKRPYRAGNDNYINWISTKHRQDDAELINLCFEYDWECSRIPKIVKKQPEINELKQFFQERYKFIKDIYKFYASQNPIGDIWCIQNGQFFDFIHNCKIIDYQMNQDILNIKYIAVISGSRFSPIIPFSKFIDKKKKQIFQSFPLTVNRLDNSLFPQYNAENSQFQAKITQEDEEQIFRRHSIYVKNILKNRLLGEGKFRQDNSLKFNPDPQISYLKTLYHINQALYLKSDVSSQLKNYRNPERGINRFQFMELLVRIAEEKYIQKYHTTKSHVEAIQMLWSENLAPIFTDPIYNNQYWRDDRYWNKECDTVMKYYKNILDQIYLNNKKERFMRLEEFNNVVNLTDLIELDQISSNTYLQAFNNAMMTQIDELGNDRIFNMSNVEFYEAIARVAEEASLLPPPGDQDDSLENRQQLPLAHKIEGFIVKLQESYSYKFSKNFPKIKESIFAYKYENSDSDFVYKPQSPDQEIQQN